MSKKIDAELIENAQRLMPAGTTVYSIVRSVAASGMSRTIDFYVFRANADGEVVPRYVTYTIAQVLGMKQNDRGALKVSGCGMDMCFHCVYETAAVLYGDGYKLKNETL